MTREEIEEINDILTGKNKDIIEACAEIKEIQKGDKLGLKTGIAHLDYFTLVGLDNLMVFIGSRPSMGKTHTASKIKKNLFDPEINPDQNIAILDLNWEMQAKYLVLRAMRETLGRSMRDILSKQLTEEENMAMKDPINKLKDKRVLTINKVIEGDAFVYLVEKYMEKNEGKRVVLFCDHLHILQEKSRIDSFLGLCNGLKLKYKNLSFIFFFQLNRTLENFWRGTNDAKFKVNPKNFVPNSSHIYNTDMLMQYGDVIMTQVIPQVVDLDEYASVTKERNPHLKNHFVFDDPENRTARLKGRNRIYYHYIKIRLNDDFDDPRTYCDILNQQTEERVTEEYYSGREDDGGVPDLNFGMPNGVASMTKN